MVVDKQLIVEVESIFRNDAEDSMPLLLNLSEKMFATGICGLFFT